MPSPLLRTRHVVGSKTPQFHFLISIPENLNNSNYFWALVLLMCTRNTGPSTVIRLLLNIFATILVQVVFQESPIIHQPIMNRIPLATADRVGVPLPHCLVPLPFLTTVIASGIPRYKLRLQDLLGQGVLMMPFPLFNRDCRTPINLLPMIFLLRARRSHHRNLLTRTNTTITTQLMNLQNATGTVDLIQGLTILSNEMNPIIIFPLPRINTPYPSHLRDLRGPRPFKHKPSPAVRSGEYIITRGLAPRRTSVAIGPRGTPPSIISLMRGTGSGTDNLCLSLFRPLTPNRFQVACRPLLLRGIGDTRVPIRVRTSPLS